MKKNIIKKFFEPVMREKKVSFKAIIPAILSSLIGIITVYLLKEITNNISRGLNESIIPLIILFVACVIFFYITVIISRNWTHGTIWPTFRAVLYKKYISLYVFLDNNESERVGSGKMIAMIDKGIHSWVALIEQSLVEILSNSLFIVYSFIFIGFINIYYLIIVLFLFSTIFILTVFLQKRAKIYRIERRDINIGITKKFVNILMSKFEILQNGKFDNEIKYILDRLKGNIRLNAKIQNYNIVTDILMKIFIDGSKVGVILMFGIGYGTNIIDFGEFVSLMSIVYILDQIFTKSIHTYIDFTKIIVDVEKLWDFFDHALQIKGYHKGKSFEYSSGEIEIKNLSFGYNKGNKIFNKLNLKIEGGKVLALIGNSGSGKSTLAKLIAGYIHSDSGDIIIDNQKLKKTSLKSYYKNIGYLTQEPSVFDGSVLDNLTYAIERDLQDGELEKIIKLAKCEFIYDLPKGLETEIGERGVKLSGGQRQRLALAKIFLKDPKIIILDEPTSALDSFSEEQITKAMHNLFKNRTVIVIAHRLQTVKHADRILVIENGEVVEDGNHKSLVKEKGTYAKMLELQSGF
ncbi:ABC transporter ATP-binding protein [Candidatus Gracilibacteria bacterium 28_42_T64]|nr:ABC transporter ATP-binding protein [Candidatus Gracilibacteria bacterium 28_42_T64]